MNHLRTAQVIPVGQLKNCLTDHLYQLADQVSPLVSPEKILRMEFSCEPEDILAWLGQQRGCEKIYWFDRAGDWESAGIGVTDLIQGKEAPDLKSLFEHFQSVLTAGHPHLRYYGGFSFDKTPLDNRWEPFGQYRFLVPRFELSRLKSDFFFAVNLWGHEANPNGVEQLLREAAALQFPSPEYREPMPRLISRSDVPDRKSWDVLFEHVQGRLKTKVYEKIVLARESTLQFSGPPDPVLLTERLKAKTSGCFHFCFQVSPDAAFLGATPERLYKRSGTYIETEAIAGTRPRGLTPQEDQQLKEALLNSLKDAEEHRFVADFIQRQLAELCSTVEGPPDARLLELNGGHHLITRFTGRLRNNIGDERILTSLHPTPAVGGTPTQEALKAIRDVEPFQRGWYAGPVGYIGHDTAEFAVAIRSGLIHQNTLSLYAGAGIVAASKAVDEWEEIENKIGGFINVLNT